MTALQNSKLICGFVFKCKCHTQGKHKAAYLKVVRGNLIIGATADISQIISKHTADSLDLARVKIKVRAICIDPNVTDNNYFWHSLWNSCQRACSEAAVSDLDKQLQIKCRFHVCHNELDYSKCNSKHLSQMIKQSQDWQQTIAYAGCRAQQLCAKLRISSLLGQSQRNNCQLSYYIVIKTTNNHSNNNAVR